MARDIRTGVAGPPRKPKKKVVQQVRPDDRGGPRPVAPAPPQGRPEPKLQGLGFHGPISEFNERVQLVIDSHRKARGYDPSPGVVLDVARSQTAMEQIPHLFSATASRLGAKARTLTEGMPKELVLHEPDHLLTELKTAVDEGRYEEFMRERGDEVVDAARDDIRFAKKMVPLVVKGQGQHYSGISQSGGTLFKIVGVLAKAGSQIETGLLVGPPTLAWEESKATYKDVGAVVHGKVPTHLAKTNVKLAKGVATGVVDDFRHPLRNPGFFFLDLFSIASLGAGSVTRIGAAGRAFSRGEGVRAATEGVVRRPRGGRMEMRKGDATEQRLGSNNMLINAYQRITNDRRNARMAKRSEGYPAGTLSIVRPLIARDVLEGKFEPLRMKFSSEAKFRRERQARLRVENHLAMGLKHDIEAVSKTSERYARFERFVPTPLRRGLTIGEQKALQVITLDDPNPLQAWRAFHERMIAQEIGDVAGHRAHLAALKLAEKTLANPSKKFKQAATIMYDLINEMERLKYEELNLTPEIGERRVIMAGEVVRTGERVRQMDVVRTPTGAAVKREAGTQSVYTLDREVRQAETVLRGEERKLQTLERALAKPSRTGKRAKRPKLEESVRLQRESVATWREEVASARRKRENEGPQIVQMERQSPASAYMPFISRARSPRRESERGQYPAVRDAGYGIGPARELAEVKYAFDGQSIRIGDFRIDATNLVAEAYARTVQFVAKRHQHKALWDAGTPTRQPGMRPVRDVKDIPDKLRELMDKTDQGMLTERDAALLDPTAIDNLNKFLYPGHKNKRTGEWVLDEPIENVRWVDPALFDLERAPFPSAVKVGPQLVNELVRVPTLFLRFGYALNAVSNAGMAVLEQGHHMPPNMVRSLRATDLYGERVARRLDDLVGASKSKSYVDERNLFGVNVVGRGLAQMWSRFADDYFRRAALIHELRRLGHDIPLRKMNAQERANLERILSPKATPKEAAAVVEASRRANKAMVEFDNQTWVEREILKQVIFVYPWVSRSLVWSVRSIVEHPVKADILAQIGQDEIEENPILFKHVPEWFRKGGYVPVGFDDKGQPIVVNGTSVNSWSTLSQMMDTVQAGFLDGNPGTEFNSSFELLGPTAKFLVRGITGKDDYGNAYPGPDWFGAAKDVLLDLPQATAYERGGKKSEELRGIDLTDRETLIKRLNSGLKQTVLSPGWLNGYGILLSGGFTPRSVHEEALYARYWKNQTPEKRHAMEQTLIRKALHLQADLLDKKLPGDVREAVELSGQLEWAAKLKSQELGRTVPTGTLERTLLDIDTLVKNHKIPADEAKELRKKARRAETPIDQRRFHTAILYKYAGAKALQEWDDDVHFVASFTKQNLAAHLHTLGHLTDQKAVTANQEQLYAAGRQALAYKHKIRDMRDEAEQLTSAERDVKLAQLRAYVDEQDKPIKVNGKVVAPSPVRLAWALLSPRDRQDAIHSLAVRGWGSMSNFDKEIVGKKVPPKVSAAWAIISQLKAEYKAQNYTSANQDQILAVVKQMDKQGYQGILQDYLFSIQPKIRRLEVLRPYQQLKGEERKKFNSYIGDYARQVASALKSGNYDNSELRGYWTKYVTEQVRPWLAEPAQSKLRAWLEPFGPDFLSGLIGA